MTHCRFGAIAVALSACAGAVLAQLPPGFVDEKVAGELTEATVVCFAPAGSAAAGRMFVCEKNGYVWPFENGVKSPEPLIDISEEVGNWGDYGLIGFALDPDFSNNGYMYLAYVVDYYHLKYFGTADYDPTASIPDHDTIARVTRYTARASDGFRSVDYSSRVVLVGESMTTGIPMCHNSHGIGVLFAFGEDGTLLIACGEASSYETTDTGGPVNGSSNTALADGIITLKEDVGAFRAQVVDSHSGKILRVDPATGNGLPSNPFYDPSRPRAPQSRVWALGLRNPYRMCVRPGTGSTNPSDGRPGVIYLGDVGWASWEDLNVCTGPGLNFGWPLFEGLTPCPNYQATETVNQEAPNPLFGGGCSLPYLRFKDLCIQDTLTPSWPNPCDPQQQIPPTIRRFVHTRPAIDWRRESGPARTGIFDSSGAAVMDLGTPGCPVAGPSFSGNCSTGGLWYTGPGFPAQYLNTYFHADFGEGWIKCARFDSAQRPLEIQPFMNLPATHIACLTMHPLTGDLYYLTFTETGPVEVHRITYFAGNQPPVAVATATPDFGQIPLAVQFDGSLSTDPEGLPLTYDWDFGDGSAHSDLPSPSHVYYSEDDITDLGTVVAKIYSLDPPHPTGNGNPDPAVMRDWDLPDVGSTDFLRQYDTSHSGQQGSSDWIGYTFAAPHQFVALIYQEGARDNQGGWWDGLSVETFDGSAWQPVSDLACEPAFVTGNNGPGFRNYWITFTPTTATGIRLSGSLLTSTFVSVGELRVLAADHPFNAPRCRTARLTVTDEQGAQSAADVTISLNNTPPSVTITSPVDGALYSLWRTYDVPLTATITDAEQGAGELSCVWQTVVHHNNHTHNQPPDPNCSTTTTVTTHGDDCHDYYYEFRLIVSDPWCLSTTTSVYMYPNCCRPDFNNDGFLDPLDYNLFINAFEGGDIAADYNADTFLDPLDYNAFINDFEAGCP